MRPSASLVVFSREALALTSGLLGASSSRAGIAALVCLWFLAVGCRFYPLGAPGPGEGRLAARARRDLPPTVAAYFTPVYPSWGLVLDLKERKPTYELYEFGFWTFSEVYQELQRITGVYYRTLKLAQGERAPLLVDMPILGGAKDDYLACRVFGRWAAAAGLSSFYLHQDADILTGERDAAELDRLMRDCLIAYRKTLQLFVTERSEVDPMRLGSIGISLGAIRNVVLIAVEPRLRANLLCLGGGDLAGILVSSQERMVLRYMERRKRLDGLDPGGVAAEFRREFSAEPIDFARYVPPENALLFVGSFDDKVPYRSGLLLREALGRPALHVLPLGHYTGLLAAPYAARKGFAWMVERFQGSHSERSP